MQMKCYRLKTPPWAYATGISLSLLASSQLRSSAAQDLNFPDFEQAEHSESESSSFTQAWTETYSNCDPLLKTSSGVWRPTILFH